MTKEKGMRMIDAYVNAIKNNYSRVDGRMHRGEFWWFTLANSLILYGVGGFLIYAVNGFSGATGNPFGNPLETIVTIIFFIYFLAIFLPSLSAQVRRLHDVGLSGWFLLLYLIPYLGAIIILIIDIVPSSPRGEKYGPYFDSYSG